MPFNASIEKGTIKKFVLLLAGVTHVEYFLPGLSRGLRATALPYAGTNNKQIVKLLHTNPMAPFLCPLQYYMPIRAQILPYVITAYK